MPAQIVLAVEELLTVTEGTANPELTARLAVVLKQLLEATTNILPLDEAAALEVTVMELVPWPAVIAQPVGTVHT